jgi:hypothetical protein
MSAPQQRDEPTREPARTLPAGAKPSGYSLALNFLPLLHLLAGAAVVWFVDGAAARIGVALAWIYLLPPLMGRVAVVLFGAPQGEGLGQEARAYKVWWFLTQLQVVFNRFGFLEELLRMVPGLYALWLNAWGARVSPLVYWGPGAAVLDRQAARIGPGAVIGARAVLSGHLAVKDSSGAFRVTLAPVEIGASALIGAYAGIGPGCSVAAGEEVPAAAFLRPMTQWTGGRRVKPNRPRLG